MWLNIGNLGRHADYLANKDISVKNEYYINQHLMLYSPLQNNHHDLYYNKLLWYNISY